MRSFYRDKTVLVTGATGGIGSALARALAPAGARLALSDRRRKKLEGAIERLPAPASGAPPPLAVACDVSRPEQVAGAVAEVEAAFGPVDVAILNAGIGVARGIDDFTVKVVRKTLEINLFGVLHFVEVLLPSMLERGTGTIAATSSLARDRGMPQVGAYSASKAALSSMLESLRLEAAPRGVTITTLEPGFIRTSLTTHDHFPTPFKLDVDDAARRILEGIARSEPVVRFPRPLAWLSAWSRSVPPSVYDRVMRRFT